MEINVVPVIVAVDTKYLYAITNKKCKFMEKYLIFKAIA